ncbi:rhomboid family intramembrane serine protease [Pilimelia columellifera]|uniref:Rhomboid family intramembrane serine protease n=1 Tax=Pilimelia columellifera subsp. columellifera TaxID=706583 RepID=A0ABP6AL76_9ACTN
MTEQPPAVPTCYRHPSRETWVRCTRCDRPICPDCMRQAAVGHQCPDCVAEGRRTQRQTRTAFGGTTAGQHGHVTKALIGLNVLAMVISAISAGGGGLVGGGWGGLLGGITPVIEWGGVLVGRSDVPILFPDGAVYGGIVQGEFYRLLTNMFLHYGLLHLALNMWALWVLGGMLEAGLGRLRFAALYLLSGLGGAVAVFLTHAPNAPPAAGASGAVFGMFAALFIALRRLGRDTSGVVPIIVINLVLTLTVPGIAIAGHLGGLVTGAVVAAVLVYAPHRHRNGFQLAGCGAVLIALTALTAVGATLLTG